MFAQSVFNAMHRPTLSGMTQPRWGWDGLSGRFSQGTPLFPVLNQAVHQVILLATHRFGLSCRKERGTLGWRTQSRWDCLMVSQSFNPIHNVRRIQSGAFAKDRAVWFQPQGGCVTKPRDGPVFPDTLEQTAVSRRTTTQTRRLPLDQKERAYPGEKRVLEFIPTPTGLRHA